MDSKILFQGELQLMRWSESSTNGATVTFWVHPDDLESFKLIKVRAGKQAGQRLACVMVEIADDESATRQPDATPEPTERPRPREYRVTLGDLALLAVRWCKNPDFQEWRLQQSGLTFSYGSREEDCKMFILNRCGLLEKHGGDASRKQLDTDPDAAALFHQRIRIPFMQWKGLHP